MSAIEDIQKAAERVKAEGKSKPRVGRHPVNQPMIDHWLDAMGTATPSMWTRRPPRRRAIPASSLRPR